jgi:hypothetical protein
VAEAVVKTSQSAEAEIGRRLQSTLQVVREDEVRFKRVIEVRRLKRQARKGLRVK